MKNKSGKLGWFANAINSAEWSGLGFSRWEAALLLFGGGLRFNGVIIKMGLATYLFLVYNEY